MKKLATAVLLLCILACCRSNAQAIAEFKKMLPEQKARLVTDSLKKILSLTADQYARTYTTVLEATNKAMPIVKSDDSRSHKKQQLKQLLAMAEARLQKIFTQQQYALYQSKKQKAIDYYRWHWQADRIVFTVPE